MKVLRAIKKFIFGVIVCAFLLFAIGMSILLLNYNEYGLSQFGDTTLVIVKSRLASEEYKKGDLILVQSTRFDLVKEGDELFAYRVAPNGAVDIDLGYVTETHKNENAVTFKNGSTYSMDYIIGKTSEKHEKIGTYLSIIESKWGFFFAILIPCFIFFLWGIYALIIEIKYGEYDDDEDDEFEKEKNKKDDNNHKEDDAKIEEKIEEDEKKVTIEVEEETETSTLKEKEVISKNENKDKKSK